MWNNAVYSISLYSIPGTYSSLPKTSAATVPKNPSNTQTTSHPPEPWEVIENPNPDQASMNKNLAPPR